VVLKAEGPTLDPDMLLTLMVGLLSFTLLFLGIFLIRYGTARVEYELALRDARASTPSTPSAE
jgi:hypothetical protein